MSNAAAFQTVLFTTLTQLVDFIIREGFIRAMVARDGAYNTTHELHQVDRQLRNELRAIVASGVALGSFEFFCELNRVAGYNAIACERLAPEGFSGNRARYIEIWDALATWSYYRAEQLRPAAEVEELRLAA